MLGSWLRDVMRANAGEANFRVFGPDETASNRLSALFEATDRAWMAERRPGDDHLAPDGRVMEVLSEHLCQGWLEGYLLTGRHGLFNCYEAFIHIIDSMFNQHAKWLKVTRGIPWRRPIASLNYLLSSHVWRQDHNGFSHQDPGFIDHVVNKKAEIIRVYLPPDANTLLSVMDHCLRSRDYVNVVVAGKQPTLDWLTMDDAILHCTRGIGTWDWASSDDGAEPDVVLGCAGDVPTLEVLAAAALLREHLPELKVRVVNVVDLMRLQGSDEHPHGLSDHEFDALFTAGPAGDLRLPRLPVAHPPPDLPAHQPPQPPRPRLQGGGHDDDALRHGHAQRHGPLPPRDRRHRPRAGPRAARRAPAPADGRRAPAPPRVHARARRRLARRARLDLAALAAPACASSSSTRAPAASSCACSGPATSSRPSATCGAGRGEALEAALADLPAPDAVGHRVVHGGARFRDAVLVDDDVVAALGELTDLAPLHQPAALAGMAAVGRALPDVPAVACFDTAFHATLPAAAATYALPREWRERFGLRRFGFHGLSHAYASRRAAAARVVSCHLGAGASLAAVRDGVCVDTTMGFTPMEGLVMATRAGSVDPGLVLWLLRHGLDADALEQGLDREGGVRGLAGDADMRARPRARRRRRPAGDRRLRPPPAGRRSPRWRPRSAASTRSSSPAAWASTRPRSARARRPGSGSWAWRSTPRPTRAPRPTRRSARPARAARTLVVTAREDLEVARQACAACSRDRRIRRKPQGLGGEPRDGVRCVRHDDRAMVRRGCDRP